MREAPKIYWYQKQTEGGDFDYFQVDEIEDSKWVLITVNFDDKCKIKAAVGQHLIDQPEIKRADEILSECEAISYKEYLSNEYDHLKALGYIAEDDVKDSFIFSFRVRPIPGAEPIEARVFLAWNYRRFMNLIFEIDGELSVTKTVRLYQHRVPLKGEIVHVYWDKEDKRWKFCYWKSFRYMWTIFG